MTFTRVHALAATAALAVVGVAAIALEDAPSPPETAAPGVPCPRLFAEDQPLLPDGACDSLGPWWQTATPPPQVDPQRGSLSAMLADPQFTVAGLRFVNGYGAVADDGIDDTPAIQAAIDSAHDAGVHGFLVFLGGTYDVSSVLPSSIHGTTFWGYNGVTFKRLPMQDESAVMIQAKQYHPRILYRCGNDGTAQSTNVPCEPVRILGMTLDGNALEQGPFQDYELQHQHIVMIGTLGNVERQAVLEVADTLLENGAADGIAVDVNANVTVNRVVCDAVFRGCVNNLRQNSVIEIEDVYASSQSFVVITSFDGEPSDSSWSQGTDPVTGEDMDAFDVTTGLYVPPSKRCYMTMRRVVLGSGIDFKCSKGAPAYAVGGWFRARDYYQLRPRFNLEMHEGEFLCEDCYLRVSALSTGVTRDPGERRSFDSWVRMPRDATFRRTQFDLDIPSDAEIASVLATRPRLWIYGLRIELANPSTPQTGRRLRLEDVAFTVSDTRSLTGDVRKLAIYYEKGDAQDTSPNADGLVTLDGVSCSEDFLECLRMWQGGGLVVRNALLPKPIVLCSYAHPAGNYAFTAETDVVLKPGSAAPSVCSPNNGTDFSWSWETDGGGP